MSILNGYFKEIYGQYNYNDYQHKVARYVGSHLCVECSNEMAYFCLNCAEYLTYEQAMKQRYELNQPPPCLGE